MHSQIAPPAGVIYATLMNACMAAAHSLFSGPEVESERVEIHMDSAREKEILEKTIAILRDSLSPRRILLFGSRAGKRYAPGADFDIAVDHPRPQARQARKILESVNECAGLHKIDLVYLPDVDGDFRAMILETGRIIYEKSA